MHIDIDWFEEYFNCKTKEEKIEWLKNKHSSYKEATGHFTDRAHLFYAIIAQKLSELNSFNEINPKK